MEFLKAQAKYISEQMRGMSISQRLAIAMLVVILLGATWWMIQWGRQAEWTAIWDQALEVDDIQRIEAQLVAAGIETKVENERVLVRGGDDERRRAAAFLGENNAAPKDTSLGYASLFQEDNVWESDSVKRWKQHRALETELSAIVSEFHGIKDARVQIVVPQRRGIGRTASTASASVKVAVRDGGTLGKQRILAIASYVAGAVPGLQVKNVTLTDGNRSYRPPDPSEGLATDLLDIQRREEEHAMRKIYDQLKHIDGVVVNVHAKLRQSDEHSEELKLGDPKVISEESKTQEMKGASAAREPAVKPNTGGGLASAGTGSTSNLEEVKTEFDPRRDEQRIRNSKLRGSLEQLTASVNVPHRYLLRIIEAQQPGTEDTSAAAIQKVANVELPRIKEQVKPLLGATSDEGSTLVVVDWYYDVPAEEGPAAAASAPIDFLAMAKGYGPQVGLGLLAAFSLLMVFRIAKKAQASVASIMPEAVGAGAAAGGSEVPLQTLGGGVEPVGEAQEMPGVLMGHEVDEETVRTQQIVKQVDQMINEDPAAVATIVAHWLKVE
jgi:flagellar M-ring protein FliF